MSDQYVATYLSDHLAGSVAALELLEHLEKAHAGTAHGTLCRHAADRHRCGSPGTDGPHGSAAPRCKSAAKGGGMARGEDDRAETSAGRPSRRSPPLAPSSRSRVVGNRRKTLAVARPGRGPSR